MDALKFARGTVALCPNLKGDRLSAIADFAYNLGLGSLQASTLRRVVNAGNWEAAKVQLMRWVQSTRQRGFAYRNTAGIAAVGLHWQLGGAAVAALSIGGSRVRLPLTRATELATLMRTHWPVCGAV